MSDTHDSRSIPRRDFVTHTFLAGVAGFANRPSEVMARQTPALRPRSVAKLEHADFESLVGQKFSLVGSAYQTRQQRATLVLKEAVRHDYPDDKKRPRHIRQSGFSLLFVAVNGEELENGIHTVRMGRLGTIDLFLHRTVLYQQRHLQHYEAVFN